MKKYLLIIPIIVAILVILIATFFLLTIFDSEWRDNEVMAKIQDHYQVLLKYKEKNGSYPDSLTKIGLADKHCILGYCYDLLYKVSEDKQAITMVSEVNWPFIVYFKTDCQNGYPCGGYALQPDYEAEQKSFPTYDINDPDWSIESGWVELK